MHVVHVLMCNVCKLEMYVTYVTVCNACNACNACNTCVVRVKWCNVCNECKCMKCSNSPAASSSSSGNCRLRPRTGTLKSGLARDVTATLSRSARSNPPRHIGDACRWLRCASKPLFVSKAIPHPLHLYSSTWTADPGPDPDRAIMILSVRCQCSPAVR